MKDITNPFRFLIVSILDFISIFTGLLGLMYVSSSIFESFKSTTFVYILIFIKLVYNTRYYKHIKVGIILCTIGIIVMITSTLIYHKKNNFESNCKISFKTKHNQISNKRYEEWKWVPKKNKQFKSIDDIFDRNRILLCIIVYQFQKNIWNKKCPRLAIDRRHWIHWIFYFCLHFPGFVFFVDLLYVIFVNFLI